MQKGVGTMGRRRLSILWAGALALALILGLRAGAASGEAWDANVIFLALNDSPVPLADSSMPINVGGTIYIPYYYLDANQNGGIQFGVYNGGQNRVHNTLTLYNSEPRNLTFDLRTGVSYDYYPDGAQQDPTAIIRNGQIYVSASSTCRYFGLRYTYSNIALGDKSYPFVRIWNSSAALSDAQFISAANTSYHIQLQNYYRAVMGQGSETPAPSESIPAATPSPEAGRRGVRVYLAIRCETGEAGEEMLDSLLANGYGALILFPAEEVAEQDGLIRRAVGEGHMIGLIPPAGGLASARSALEEAQVLLSHIARTATPIVYTEDPALSAGLEAEGWLCWESTFSVLPDGSRSAYSLYNTLVQGLEGRDAWARITLDDSQASYDVLTRLLRTLQADRYSVRLPVETTF